MWQIILPASCKPGRVVAVLQIGVLLDFLTKFELCTYF